MKKYNLILILLIAAVVICAGSISAQDKVAVNTGVDFYNRYVWRGLDIASAPSIQPSIALTYSGFEIGTWGAYTLSNDASESDEIDFYTSYTFELDKGASFQLIATDYYFPNAGIDLFNFNNYDDAEPGAHLLELGLAFTGPETFPITLSGYMNVYNDAGNNTYFQADYPVKVGETELGLFCGATAGSTDNSGYYSSDEFAFINVGVSAARDIKVSESFTIPLTFALVVNPDAEISYLLVGMSF